MNEQRYRQKDRDMALMYVELCLTEMRRRVM